ncbi:CaiB/BaiF CoA transferase family protein [Desertimonas flava]|uniref:CaiB/BaiF CoA transferase family protein n=1 Tax=Desertimonas flava TaxID=2064846 RepID=UPI000E344AE9|nr:CoA transferase [Desertimonas flava]
MSGPLTGVRVLELGSFIAGPFSGQLLGDYGADVVKVEDPTSGDPMRTWGVTIDGDSIWWPAIARNKRSVAIDLRDERGRDVVRRLAAQCDIIVENFRPGRLDEWGLTYDVLAAENPTLVVVRISGFGQTGPRSRDAGFGSIGEAMGGIRHTTGSPDRPPARAGVSLGDALAAMFGVIGALAALTSARATGKGQVVDVAIYEAVAALMESSMADLELGGVLRGRSGSVLPGVAPSNVYPAADGSEILIAGNADSVFSRLCSAMGRRELAIDERYATHSARGERMEELDALIADWTSQHSGDELLAILEEHAVPAGRIYTAADMLTDPHYLAREMVLRATSHQGWNVPMTGIVPKFSATPGAVRHPGPRLGQHTEAVLRDVAGIGATEIADLVAAQLIAVDPNAARSTGSGTEPDKES